MAGVFYFLDTYAVNQSESTKDHTTFELTNQNAKLHSFSGSFTFGNSRNLSLKSCQKYASSNNYGMYILTQMLTNIKSYIKDTYTVRPYVIVFINVILKLKKERNWS